MKKLWQKFEKLLGVYRWHPKIALRYLPVVDKLHEIFQNEPDILEVGSGGLGMAPYIKQKVVGLDVNFSPPIHPRLIPVIGSAQKLAFADKSFDVVISLDMLEHLDPADRQQAINEIIRVADKFVVIGVPCGKLSQQQDVELALIYEKQKQSQDLFLGEHLKFGLPETIQIEKNINHGANSFNRKIKIEIVGNLNLKVRKFLMSGWLTQNLLIDIFFRKVCLLLIPLLRQFNQEPDYRKLFFITFL